MALVDLVKIVINTTGTGALSLGAAVFGFRGREALTDGETYDYSIQQEAAWEYGRCTFLAATNQVIRTPIGSSNGGSPINIQAGASIAFVLLAETLNLTRGPPGEDGQPGPPGPPGSPPLTWPQTYNAVGDGVADDTAAVNNALAAVPAGGTLPLYAGKTFRTTNLVNARNVGFEGGGQIVVGAGNAAYSIRSYARRSGYVHGREYLYRFYQRVGASGTTLTGYLDGDSTVARGNGTAVGGISGTTLTVTATNGTTLAIGSYITAVSGTCRIVSQLSGTTFGNGTYQLSESASIATGSTIAVGNGGGFAGSAGEPQQLLRKYLRRNSVRNTITLTNLAIGGSTWQDLVARNKQQYLDVNSDIVIVKAPVNKGPSIAADILSMRQYFNNLRAATYGRVDLLTIVLVGYSPAHDTAGGRTSLYQELMHEACLQCVDDFKVVYSDIHGIFTDASWMPSLYLDAIGVHPGGFLQQQIYYQVGRALIEAGGAQLSTGDDWIPLSAAGTYTAYDNGFGSIRIRLKAGGEVNLIGGVAPPSGTVTANDTLTNCPNSNYYPDTSVVFDATIFKTDTSWGRVKCGVDVAGRIFARETVSGVVAVIFGSDTAWSVFTS